MVDGQPLRLTFRAREGWWWPPSCRNTRGGWTTPLAHVSSEGGVVVASVVSKHETEGLWWVDKFCLTFQAREGGGEGEWWW